MSSVLEQLPVVTAPRGSKASSFRSSCRRDMIGKARFGGQVLQPSTPELFYIAPVAIPLMSTDHDPQLLHQLHQQQACHQHQSASQAFTSSEHVGSLVRGLDISAGRMQIADSAVTAFMTVHDLAQQQHPSWESSSRRMPAADEESGGGCSLSLLSEASEEATAISLHLLFDSQAVKNLVSSCTEGPFQVSVKHSSIEILDESWLTPEEIYQGSSVIRIPRKALPDHSTLLHIYIYQQKRKVSAAHQHVPTAAPGFISSFGSLPSSEAVQHNVIASMESAAPTATLRPSETMIEDTGSRILSRGGVMNQAGCKATASTTADDSMADDIVLLSVLPVLCLPAAAAVEIQHWYISSLLLSSSSAAAASTHPDSAAAATSAPDMPLPWGVSEGTASSSTSTSATACMLSGSRSVDSSSCMRQMGVQQPRQYSGTASGCVHCGSGLEWKGCSTPTEFSSKMISSSSGRLGKKRAPILPPGSFDSPLLPGSLLSAASLGSSSSAAAREDFEQPHHQQAGSLHGVEGGLQPYNHNVLQPPKIKSPISRLGSMQHHISGRQRTCSSSSAAVLSANAAAAAVTSHGNHTIVDMPSIIMSHHLSAHPASGFEAITDDDKTRVDTADESNTRRFVSGTAAAAAASWLNVQEAAGKLMFTVSEEPAAAAATPTVAAASTEAGSFDESGVNAGQQHEEVNRVDPPFAFGPLIQSLSQAGRDYYSHSDVTLPTPPALALMLPAAGDTTPSEGGGGLIHGSSLNLQGEGGLGRGSSSSSSSSSRSAQDDNQYIIDTTTGRDYVTSVATNLLPFLSPPASSEHLQGYYNGGTAQRPAKITRSVRSEDLASVGPMSCPASTPAARPSSTSLIIPDSKSTNRDAANYKAERATTVPGGHINSKALRAGMIQHGLMHQELSAAASTGPDKTTPAAATAAAAVAAASAAGTTASTTAAATATTGTTSACTESLWPSNSSAPYYHLQQHSQQDQQLLGFVRTTSQLAAAEGGRVVVPRSCAKEQQQQLAAAEGGRVVVPRSCAKEQQQQQAATEGRVVAPSSCTKDQQQQQQVVKLITGQSSCAVTDSTAATGPLQGVSCAADYRAVDDNSSHIQRLQSLVKFYYSAGGGGSRGGGSSTSESGAMINSGFEALDEQMMMSGNFGDRFGFEQYNKHHAHVYHTVFVRFASDMDRLLTAARMTNKGLKAADESCHDDECDECDELQQGGHQPQPVQDHDHHQQMAERQLDEQQEPLLLGCLIQEIRGTAPKLLRSLVKGEMWACLALALQCIEDSKAMTLITNRLPGSVQLNANEASAYLAKLVGICKANRSRSSASPLHTAAGYSSWSQHPQADQITGSSWSQHHHHQADQIGGSSSWSQHDRQTNSQGVSSSWSQGPGKALQLEPGFSCTTSRSDVAEVVAEAPCPEASTETSGGSSAIIAGTTTTTATTIIRNARSTTNQYTQWASSSSSRAVHPTSAGIMTTNRLPAAGGNQRDMTTSIAAADVPPVAAVSSSHSTATLPASAYGGSCTAAACTTSTAACCSTTFHRIMSTCLTALCFRSVSCPSCAEAMK